MSSFFTIPGAQKKRKRPESSEVPKKRLATTKSSSRSQRPSGSSTARTAPSSSSKAAKNRLATAPPSSSKKQRQQPERDESISGSDSESDDDPAPRAGEEDAASSASDNSDHEGETAAERRLRLAERYLDNVRQEVAGAENEYAFDAEEIDRELIAARLQEDVAEAKGKVYRALAADLDLDNAYQTGFRWSPDNVNGVATCAPYAYLVTRDMWVSKWRIQDLPRDQWPQTTRRKPKKPPAPPKRRPERVACVRGDTRKDKDKAYHGHTGAVLAVAASQDGKYVVTAGADRRLVVHDAETLKPVRSFSHHRDAVTSLAFRRGSNQLFSASSDRTVKVWSIDDLAYVETLFGHQNDVVDIDALAQERCVSVGSRDRTARLWKVAEETQLVFRGGGGTPLNKKGAGNNNRPEGVDPMSLAHEGSMDRIAMLDDELFVTGADNGSISLWSLQRKRPVFVLPLAHGIEPPLSPAAISAELNPDPKLVPPPQPRWITALRTIPYSDLILSGSWDGCVRVWRLSDDKRKIEPVGVLGESFAPVSHDKDLPKLNGARSSSKSAAGKKAAATVITNGDASSAGGEDAAGGAKPKPIRGIINDIALFERGDRGKDGVCVVVAVGKEHRLGRWKMIQGGRNGAFVFEIPRRVPAPPAAAPAAAAPDKAAVTNGVHGSGGGGGGSSSDDEDEAVTGGAGAGAEEKKNKKKK